MDSSLWWFIGAMLLGILEIFTLDLTFAMLAGGALAAGIVDFAGADLWVSIATFAIVSVVLLFWRAVIWSWRSSNLSPKSEGRLSAYATLPRTE